MFQALFVSFDAFCSFHCIASSLLHPEMVHEAIAVRFQSMGVLQIFSHIPSMHPTGYIARTLELFENVDHRHQFFPVLGSFHPSPRPMMLFIRNYLGAQHTVGWLPSICLHSTKGIYRTPSPFLWPSLGSLILIS